MSEVLQLNQEARYQKTNASDHLRPKLGRDGVALLDDQLATLAELNDRQLNSPLKEALKSGDATLPEGTLLHGMGMYEFSAGALEGVSVGGIVSGELVGISEDSETHGCADFFRVPETTTIGKYLAWAKEPIVSGRLRRQRGERLLTRGVVFIVDPRADGMSQLLENDGYRNEAMAGFVRPPSDRSAKDTAAVLGGVPRGAIAGLIVEDQLLQRPEVMSVLGEYFPDLPVYGHDGKAQSGVLK